jgi:hypothetical protein
MEHLVQHMMYIHLLEQGLLQWEPLVLLMCWLLAEALLVALALAVAAAQVVIFTVHQFI